MAIAERHYREALGWLETALDAAERLGNPHAAFTIRTNEGLARLFLNELDDAASAFCDALAVCRDAGAEDLVDETLLGLAAVEASRAEFDRAARLAAEKRNASRWDGQGASPPKRKTRSSAARNGARAGRG